jgi:hypothetical protein
MFRRGIDIALRGTNETATAKEKTATGAGKELGLQTSELEGGKKWKINLQNSV